MRLSEIFSEPTLVTVRYESSLFNFLTQPFEIGLRHLKVACCDGSQETLIQMAKERIIYRPEEKNNNNYISLTSKQRFFHAVVGLSEIVGYSALLVSDIGYKRFMIPFITSTIDRFLNKPFYEIKESWDFKVHVAEGGSFNYEGGILRRNPFDSNAITDSFYGGASWLSLPNFQMSSSSIKSLLAKLKSLLNEAESFARNRAKEGVFKRAV